MRGQCLHIVLTVFSPILHYFVIVHDEHTAKHKSLAASPCFTFTQLHAVTLGAALNKQSSAAATEQLRSSWR